MYYVNENIKKLNRIGGEQGRASYLRLDMNENPEGLPEEFVERVLKEITPEFLATYPEPEILTRMLGEYHNLKQQNIFLTNGSDEAIRLIFDVFTQSGHEVTVVSPSFAMYNIYSEMHGLNVKNVYYKDDFSIDVHEILDAINENTDLVVLLNPNNPIGNAYSSEEAESIIEKSAENDAIVLIDEAYHYFYPISFIDEIEKHDNVIVLRTFSKLFSLAACRLGYAVSNPAIISYLNNAGSTFRVNAIALKFGEEILKEPQMIRQLIDSHNEGKEYLCTYLQKENYEIFAGKGNFIFIKPRKPVNVIEKGLRARKVLIKTYSSGFLSDYIRVTTGSKKAMEQFLDAFLEEEGDSDESIINGSR